MTVATPPVEETTVIKRRSPLVETWENLRRSWAGMFGPLRAGRTCGNLCLERDAVPDTDSRG